jgi:anti-sigma regulatory factor (Ser/Thr protein kinase)
MEPQVPSPSGPGRPGRAPAGPPSPLTGGGEPVAVRMFPGLPAQAGQARRWVRALASGAGIADPDDDIGLITAELFANAVLHTRSGRPGGLVVVAVTADGVIHVHDYGTPGPCPGLTAAAEGGREDFRRGLGIVAALGGGLAHLPAAWCPAAGLGDPAVRAGGCCTCCRPAATALAPPGARAIDAGQSAVTAALRKETR